MTLDYPNWKMRNYRKRTLEKVVRRVGESFPVLLVAGPRQVGKTTMLQSMANDERSYVTLDDPMSKSLAIEDPALFLQTYQAPLLIDEIQYAPELFPYLKMIVDKEKRPGSFWLTGSQQFNLMKNVSESLAGRVAILSLLGFSLLEEIGEADSVRPFRPSSKFPLQSTLSSGKLFQRIWRGCLPSIEKHGAKEWEIFYKSYVQTYLQRDLRDFAQIGNETKFFHFLRAAAARTGQLINYADFARDCNVSEPTIKSWLTILKASGIVFILEPYHNNRAKRLVKTPKLYFFDTGLCSYLAGWSNAQVLERGAMSGAMFETYVVAEIVKSYVHNGLEPPIYFYRDHDKKEIDLIVEENGVLHPVEIKKNASLRVQAPAVFDSFRRTFTSVGKGTVICLIEKSLPLDKNTVAIPVSCIESAIE